MIEEPTCLILGAGASAPYGLPVGNELRELILVRRSPLARKIAERFAVRAPLAPGDRAMGVATPVNNWGLFLERVARENGLEGSLQQFWDRFFEADRSIDWFLRHNDEEFGRIARVCIAAVLLNCEADSQLTGDWYRLLVERVFETSLESVEPGKLSIITFNYDRSFERYFARVLASQYRLNEAEIAVVMAKIPITHVYGSLGNLQQNAYGNLSKVAAAAGEIRLVRPQIEEDLRDQVGAIIRRAVYVNFIGFGFDPDNVAQLGPENFHGKRVLSTSRGVSDATRRAVRKLLPVRFEIAGNKAELDAARLFEMTDLFGPKRRAQRPVIVRRSSRFQRGWSI